MPSPDDDDDVFDMSDAQPGAAHLLNEAEQRELSRAHPAKAAAQAVRPHELVEDLLRLHAHDLAHVRRMLRVRGGASVSVIAQAMRTRLTKEPEAVVGVALRDALSPGIAATATTCALSESELAALLSGDPEGLRSLRQAGHRSLPLRVESFGSSPATRAAAWSAMVSTGHPGAVAALAWLVADSPAGWNDALRQTAAAVWRRVRQRCPLLPERPLPLERATEIVAMLNDATESAPGVRRPRRPNWPI
ncbi:hypothetical protein [Plantactinospora veratri]